MRCGCGHHFVVGLEASCTGRHLHLRSIHLSHLRGSRPRHRMVPTSSSFFSYFQIVLCIILSFLGMKDWQGWFCISYILWWWLSISPFLPVYRLLRIALANSIWLTLDGATNPLYPLPLLFIYPSFYLFIFCGCIFVLFSSALFFYVIVLSKWIFNPFYYVGTQKE